MIAVSDHGHRAPFAVLATNVIPDLHLLAPIDAFQCFPLYVYSEDGSHRRENITDWALAQFQAKHGADVTKWAIFHYVYAILHHPQYRERYAENLKRELPHVPLVSDRNAFEVCVRAGNALMQLHLNYEQVEEWPLRWIETSLLPLDWRVKKMNLSRDKRALVYNETLTLADIPPECFQYRLGNRSALEWVIDQYQISTDKRSGITSDPNQPDDPEYIARLVGRIVRVSVETVQLVNELTQSVSLDVQGETPGELPTTQEVAAESPVVTVPARPARRPRKTPARYRAHP